MEMIVYHFFGTWCIYLSRICPGFIAVCVIGGSKVFAGVLFSIRLLLAFRKRAVRRAVQVFGGSVLVMVITHIFVPDQAVTFGVLFFLGSGMLLLELLDRRLCRLAPVWGITASGMLFF